MKRAISVAVVLLGLSFAGIARGAEPCPPELAQAKTALKSAQASLKQQPKTARNQEVQAPRSQAGARSQDVQAPRSQDVQAPRSQDVQAPRSQDVQAPRSQDVQAPRSQAARAQQVKRAGGLVREGDAACKKGDMTLATQKATEALGLLK